MNIILPGNWSVFPLKQKLYSLKKFIGLNLLLLLFSTVAFAQVTVKGIIYDSDKTPLAGATIQVTGTNTRTQSDVEGKYQITAPTGSSRLTVSFGL